MAGNESESKEQRLEKLKIFNKGKWMDEKEF